VMRSWLEVAAEVAVPALLLTCDDPLLWDDEGRAALVGLGNRLLQVERVAGAGHCIRRSRPDEFHALVDAYLETHSSDPHSPSEHGPSEHGPIEHSPIEHGPGGAERARPT